MSTLPHNKIRVMLTDDSAVIRSVLKKLLSEDSLIDIVAECKNGQEAVDTIADVKPDVVILDIEMPILDGIAALPLLKQKSPQSKIIMFSSLSEKGADISLKALSLGAVECLAKPSSYSLQGKEVFFKQTLLGLIKNLAPNKGPAFSRPAAEISAPPSPSIPSPPPKAEIKLHKPVGIINRKPKILAIGSSTGGPQALFKVLPHFKDITIPIVITQHMPPTFTKILAEHISKMAGLNAMEAEEGMAIEPGKTYVARGGKHLLINERNGRLSAHLDDGPAENFCKPAVDPMLRSMMEIYGSDVLALILTGMGHDGLESCKTLVEKGGRVIAQDEATSVVWGMPGAVANAGICQAVLPIEEIGPHVHKIVNSAL